ncbi:hypothetical protein MalM25_21710 [Planctomycetes bacterium MalM25]|nr:hypothetical protein MalM25_21710 [Planctomycetes bacterium MalM25]
MVINTPSHASESSRAGRRAAFTLVELLVVIAIIGILVALLLPAVQAAREAARRSQCQNQLKQIGLALLMYADAHDETLPRGCECFGNDNGGKNQNLGTNWALESLPFLEENPLYDRYDHSTYLAGSASNQEVLATHLPVFLCPSDDAGTELVTRQVLPNKGTLPLAPGSYKGVVGLMTLGSDGVMPDEESTDVGGAVLFDRCEVNAGSQARYKLARRFIGALPASGDGRNAPAESDGTAHHSTKNAIELRQITDGMSKTFLVGEYFTRSLQDNYRVAWASSRRHFNKGAITDEAAARLPDLDQCTELIDGNLCVRSFSSAHPSIIQFVLCDGSVNAVQLDIASSVYVAYATISGEETVPAL